MALTILKNMNVNGKDDTPYMMENQMFETTNQIYIYIYHINISLLIHTDSTNVPISTNVPDSTNVPISGDCPFSSEISQFPALLSKKTGNPLRFLLKKPHKIEKWVLNVLKPIMLTIPQYHVQKGIYIYIDHSQSWVAYYYYFTHMIPSVGGL